MGLAACANESDANPPQAPIDGAAASVSPICRDIAETRKSLEDAVTSVTRLDEVGLEQASQRARVDLGSLAESARASGQQAEVEKLTASVAEFERLLAQPQLSWSDSTVRTQIQQISDDLAIIESTTGCPA
jgi:hypothetical protein